MNTFQRIKYLCEQNGLSIAELERRLNLSNGSISRWKTASPNSKALTAIADYFDVSVDYLLGREKEDYSGEERSKEFRSLQRLARNMSDEDAKKAYQLLELAFEIEDDEEDDI